MTTHEEEDVSLEGQVVSRKDTFRYLGSMLERDGVASRVSNKFPSEQDGHTDPLSSTKSTSSKCMYMYTYIHICICI
jgi:hypothetical protein